MIDYHFDWSVIARNADRLADALLLGLGLAVISLVIGSIIGLLAAYARVSGKTWLSGPVWAYVEFIRCTPLLLLIFFIYFGLPEFDVNFLDKTQSF
ncbi:MAG: ABC transporter permease subunit, partial [Phreatobacter sp.]